MQIAGGLAGIWIVEPDTTQISPSAEHVVAVRYAWPFAFDNAFAPDTTSINIAAMQRVASLKPAPPASYDPFDPPPWPLPGRLKAGNVSLDPSGCNGTPSDSVVTVNGYRIPASLDVQPGEEQLLRLVNETSDSAKLLMLRDSEGKPLPMRIVELDGMPVGGDMAHPLGQFVSADHVMLTPAGRASILVKVSPGQTVTLSGERYCQGTLGAFQIQHDLLRIYGAHDVNLPGPSMATASEPANLAETPAAKLVAFAQAHRSQVHRRALTFTEYALPKHGKIPPHASFFLTDTTNPNFRERPYYPMYRTGQSVPSNVDIVVKSGAIEEWYLFNATLEVHAFHIHQMPFVALEGPAGAPASVDTAFIPTGTILRNRNEPNYPLVKPSVTKVLLDFRNVPRGTFVYHCHMLFHEDRGMMGIIRVE